MKINKKNTEGGGDKIPPPSPLSADSDYQESQDLKTLFLPILSISRHLFVARWEKLDLSNLQLACSPIEYSQLVQIAQILGTHTSELPI